MDTNSAIQNLETYITENPSSSKAPLHMIYAGELRRLNGDTQIARRWFESVAEKFPGSDEKSVAVLGMAVIDIDMGGKGSLIDTLQITPEEEVPDTLNADRYRLLYLHHLSDNPDLADVYFQKAEEYARSHPTTQQRIAALTGMISTSVETTTTNSDDILTSLESASKAKEWSLVDSLATDFLDANPTSEHRLQVEAFQQRAEAQDPFEANRIAILLPLTGKYAPASEAIKQSLVFANTSQLELKFYDTQFDIESPEPEKAAEPKEDNTQEAEEAEQKVEPTEEEIAIEAQALIRKIVIDDGCSMIVGPLLKDSVQPLAEAAQAYRIPMISLAKPKEALEKGDHIFRVSVSIDQQVNTLINHAVDERGWTKFVAMIPDNEFGNNALEAFTAAAELRGATVLRSVSYDPAATSFLAEARQLGLKSEIPPTPAKLEKDPTLDQPVVDFDAIFIPDNYRKVPSVVSALAYEEFSVGTFRINKYAEPTYVMGLNSWNHPSIVDKGGQYLVNGIFVDAFWIGNEKESTQQFVTQYQEHFEKAPNFYSALSYDVMQLIQATLSANTESRSDVLTNLKSAYVPDPITGGSQFAIDRDLDRVLDVFVIKRGGIKVWKSPTENDSKSPFAKKNRLEKRPP